MIIFLLLCAEGTNINDKLSQFNHGNAFAPGRRRPKTACQLLEPFIFQIVLLPEIIYTPPIYLRNISEMKGVHHMGKYSRSIVLTLIITMAVIASGCAMMRGFGKFVPDDNAKTAFETFQINPDYRYYITGSDTYPAAILALHKSYSMGNDLWLELQPTRKIMSEIVTNMQTRIRECNGGGLHGFIIYDHQNKQIGTLYSFIGVGLAFKTEDHSVMKVYGPRDDDTLKSYQQRTTNGR